MDTFGSRIKMQERNKAEKKFMYLLGGIVSVVVLAFGFVLLFPQVTTDPGLHLYESFKQDTSSYVYAENIGDSSATTRQLNFYVKDNQIDPLNPLVVEVRTASRGNGDKLPAKLTQVSEDFYSVYVENVPKNQADLYIKLVSEKEINNPISAVSAQALSLRQQSKLDSYPTKNTGTLKQEYLSYMVTYCTQKVASYKSDIKETNEQIATLKATLVRQKKSLELQNGSQASDTKDKISATQDQIDDLNTTVQKRKKAIANATDSKEKYEEKMQD